MRHVAPVRTELGIPTVFNVLGPLSHPGRVTRQVLGVADPRLMDLVPDVLRRRGMDHAWVVHGSDGLDELTTTGPTAVTVVRGGELTELEVTPESVGLQRSTLDQLAIGGPEENAAAARDVLEGRAGSGARHGACSTPPPVWSWRTSCRTCATGSSAPPPRSTTAQRCVCWASWSR